MARGFPVDEGDEGGAGNCLKRNCGTFGEGRRKGEHRGRVLVLKGRGKA